MSNPQANKDRQAGERRVGDRRINVKERRELMRYEINKTPRRSGKDRRKFNERSELPERKII